MTKKVLILTEYPHNFLSLHEQLAHSDYEVMASKSVLTECLQGNLQFLSTFDVIIMDEEVSAKLPEEVYQKITQLNKPFMTLSKEVIVDGQAQMHVTYPVTASTLAEQINLLTSTEFKEEKTEEVVYEETYASVGGAFHSPVQTFHPSYGYDNFARPAKGKYTFQIANHSLIINGFPILLSPKELQLFECLTNANHTLISNEELFEQIWHKPYHLSKQPFLSNLVMKIRKKVCEEYEISDSIILNRKGIGYKLNEVFHAI